MIAARQMARHNGCWGGPAVCAAPAGSRSDKKLRHQRSIDCPIRIRDPWHRGRFSAVECGWRGFLSPRDPTALAGRSGHPVAAPATWLRSGLSLFEVIIALTIFACSMAAIGQLISTGVRGALRSRLETQAIMRCESKLAELVAGITPLQHASGVAFPDDHSWNWSVDVSAGQYPSLSVVEVTAAHPSTTKAGNVSYTLRRLVRDPQLEMLAYEKQLAAQSTQNSSTSSSSTSSGASK